MESMSPASPENPAGRAMTGQRTGGPHPGRHPTLRFCSIYACTLPVLWHSTCKSRSASWPRSFTGVSMIGGLDGLDTHPSVVADSRRHARARLSH